MSFRLASRPRTYTTIHAYATPHILSPCRHEAQAHKIRQKRTQAEDLWRGHTTTSQGSLAIVTTVPAASCSTCLCKHMHAFE